MLLLWLLFLSGAGRAASGEPIDFQRDVQPIFSRHCLHCHGAIDPASGLGLTSSELGTGMADSGRQAIVAGAPDRSELMRRVTAASEFERMPPEGPPLEASEIDVLRRWIADGAAWPGHWAYQPLNRPAPPLPPVKPAEAEVDWGWAENPIDLFVLQQLAARGMTPSPPADRRSLLRRVYFDLIGLPPTPEQVRTFLEDPAPDAYRRVVDELLSSPHYGERWARHWMDVVQFAETHGHDQDRPRPNAWPYRDYLIRALNRDTPYERFVRQQVAGDVFWPDEPESIEATGFLATGPWDESSLRDIREDTIDREIARYLDRDDVVTRVMSTFTSTTVHCARCHDHKFDPVAQEEYYSLQAVFAATDKAERPYDRDPQVARQRRALLAEQEWVRGAAAAGDRSLLDAGVEARVAQWEAQRRELGAAWTALAPDDARSLHGATLSVQPDHTIVSGGERPDKDEYVVTARVDLPGPITGVRLEVLADASLPEQGPGRQDNGNLHLNELRVVVEPLAADPESAGGAEGQPLRLIHPQASYDQEGWTIAAAIDGHPDSAWGIFPEVGRDHQATFELAEPWTAPGAARWTFHLLQTHGGGHLIGRLRLSVTTRQPPLSLADDRLPERIESILDMAPEERSLEQRIELAGFALERQIERQLQALPAQDLVYAGTNQFQPDGSFRPAAAPRVVHMLQRGDVRQPLGEAVPGALSVIAGLESRFVLDEGGDAARRAALANWLADPANALTWRSIANRVWHYHFGRGICDTPNDFGLLGSSPTHPDLLDWLAVELRERGSLKHLHRLIVTSAAYRQSSAHRAEMAALDADNRYLWRMNRRRLDAEGLRDAVLLVSGQLDRTMGGPSVRQFIETPGVHVTPNVDYASFAPDDPANRRRSVYRFVFRTIPDPFMQSLDCPDGSHSTPARAQSVSALQALALWNSPLIVYQSQQLAERLERRDDDPQRQIERLYWLALGRPPTAGELAAMLEYAERHALANACRVLLNSNEFIFLD